MIFSLLKIRKKTAAVLVGIACGLACIWLLASWQNLSREDMLNMLLGSILLVAIIIVAALVLVACITALKKIFQRFSGPGN